MQHFYNAGHVSPGCNHFGILLGFESQQFSNQVAVRSIAVLVNFINQGPPIFVIEPLELADILLVLFFRRESYRYHVSWAETPNVEPYVTCHERLIEGARTGPPREHHDLVLQVRYVAQTWTVLIIGPEVLTIRIENDGANRNLTPAALLRRRSIAVQVTE